MASSSSSSSSTSTIGTKKILIPKVWKRPHSTIYGKNVEYGNSLYSDKIGEIDSRKFNTDLPWSVRTSNQTGYLPSIATTSNIQDDNVSITNQTLLNNNQNKYNNDPILTRQRFDNLTDFDTELGLFLPTRRTNNQTPDIIYRSSFNASSDNDWSSSSRRQSLGSINPQSYRPNLPKKASNQTDAEEFEYQDKSSPFYTDRWAGKTIRHFDSDLYSNANLFKSMIL